MEKSNCQGEKECFSACPDLYEGRGREPSGATGLSGGRLVLASCGALLLPLVLAIGAATVANFVPAVAHSLPAKAAAAVGGLFLGVAIAAAAVGRIRPVGRRESL